MIRIPIAIALFVAAAADHNADGNTGFGFLRTNSRRDLESEQAHPCTGEDYLLPGTNIFRPSYVENCFDALLVNETVMAMHIQSLRDTFQQYYCFYNLANDPAASDPISYQPELGYTLFGEGEGKVNLHQELTNLTSYVLANGASLSTFWEIAVIFNKLRDAHVALPALAGVASLANGHILSLVPGRNLDEATRMDGTFVPSYRDDGELELKVVWVGANGSSTEDIVASINGMTPYEFYFNLATNTAGGWRVNSIGARMNDAFKPASVDVMVYVVKGNGRPTDFFPESFPVVYESGEEETFFSGILFLTPDSTTVMNSTDVYPILNSVPDTSTPGAAYLNFQIAAYEIQNVTSTDVNDIAPRQKTTLPLKPTGRSPHGEPAGYTFDEIITVPDFFTSSPLDAMAFKIEDDYAVLKIDSFAFVQDYEGQYAMIGVWSNFTAAAKAKGVKKAIIDISGNIGGIGITGDTLTISMFPLAKFEFFENQYDANYNDPMRIYFEVIAPIVESLQVGLINATDGELQAYLNHQSPEFAEQMMVVTNALLSFCCLGDPLCQGDPRCDKLDELGQSIQKLNDFPSGPQIRLVIEELLGAFSEYNPFNVLGIVADGLVDPTVIREVNRGGIPTNLTNQMTVMDTALYYEAVARAFQNDYFFDEYVILGDGTGGSTTCIFTSMAQQLWKNKEISGARTPLTTITYGGTKNPSDTNLAGFPATVDFVNIAYPLITAGLFQTLQFILPPNLTESIDSVNNFYLGFLPAPPYFADALPYLPVFNYYSNFMEPGAIPLQYVKMPADIHIPKIFSRVSLEDSADLASLYQEAARLAFSAYGDGTKPTAGMATETTSPESVEGSQDESFATENNTSGDEAMMSQESGL